MHKSYNSLALRGHDFTDSDFQQEMADQGINIPDKLLYTPQLNDFMLNEINKKTIAEMQRSKDPDTNEPYTFDKAKSLADKHTSAARENINTLMSVK